MLYTPICVLCYNAGEKTLPEVTGVKWLACPIFLRHAAVVRLQPYKPSFLQIIVDSPKKASV